VSTLLERQQAKAAVRFLAPALALIALFFFLPVLAGLLLSLTDFDIYAIGSFDTARFVGLGNYRDLLQSSLFWTALKNTLYFVLVGGPLSVAISLAAAVLLNSPKLRFRAFFRTVYFAPVVTTLVAVAIVWRYLYHPRYGLLNHILGWIGIDPIDWLGDPHWAMPAIILLSIWKTFGYNMLILLAGLQTIPEELYEAASIDGAGAIRQFSYISLPSLRPQFLFLVVIGSIGAVQVFEQIFMLGGGAGEAESKFGPDDSGMTIVPLIYRRGFEYFKMGEASAIAFILFILLLAVTFFNLRMMRKPS
jgi:multiple sugar transport system permease protein